MGVFQKIGNALARLMYGRNGVDQLSLAIVVGSLVLDLVSMFVAPHHLWLGNALYLVSIAAWAFALFRIFSRNLTKRRSENQRWVNWMWRMKDGAANEELAKKIRELTELYCRCDKKAAIKKAQK